MFCFYVRKKISHMIDGELTIDEKIAVEKHLNSCRRCKDIYLSLKKMTEEMRNLETLTPSPYLFSKIVNKIQAKEQTISTHTFLKPYLLYFATVCIIVVVFIAGLLQRNYSMKEKEIVNFVEECFSLNIGEFYNSTDIYTVYDSILENNYENDIIFKFLEKEEVAT